MSLVCFFGVGFCGVWSWAGFADTVSPGRQFHEVAGYVIPAPPPPFHRPVKEAEV